MELHEARQHYESFARRISDIEAILDVDALKTRIEKLEAETYANDFWDDHQRAQRTIRHLKGLKKRFDAYRSLKDSMENLAVAIELLEMGESVPSLDADVAALERDLASTETMLYLSGEYDQNDAVLEIHPGAGGTESHDWASMLYRMYRRYAEANQFSFTVNDYQDGSEAGLKQATVTIEGEYAYGKLKSEHGVHRLVRLSPFDSSNRRHTSFAGVVVIPSLDDEVDVEIKNEDLRIDTYRSSGAGGQSVNTTDSAVRITHLPTEITVSCQNERSQIKNREQAMKILKAKLHRLEAQKREEEIEQLRGQDVANAFGSQIRSYVLHPYTMVKDHRTQQESSQAQKVLDGELEAFIRSYLRYASRKEGPDGTTDQSA